MRKALYLFVLLTSTVSFSQNNLRFSQLNFVQGVNNPAAIAVDGRIMVDLIARNQWFGFGGAPTTFAVNGQYELDDDMAVGLNVYNDRIGVHQTTAISAQYAYRIFTQYGNVLAFGLGLGVDDHIIDYASTTTTMANDPAFANTYARLVFNGSMGVYYYSPTFYIGGSIPQIFAPKFDENGKAKLKAEPTYYLSTGFYIGRGSKYCLNPHIQVKAMVNTPIAADLILRNTIMSRFSIVVGYRTEQSIVAGVDMLITPMVRAGYSFNYDVGPLSRIKGASNELYLGLAFPYNNSRDDFGRRRYVGTKGGFKRTYKRHYSKKQGSRFIR
jgi:type IX secretion system PorP/SprF family membrane protein